MQYDIQAVQPGQRRMITDMISSNKRVIYDRVKVLTQRGQQCRVHDRSGRILETHEVEDLGR